jgi:excinuclease ABC subunit C
MYEVLGRRFQRALQGDDESWALPDLVVIDGGKGQLGRVVAAMQDLGVPVGAEGVDVVALAKERKHELGHGRAGFEELRARRKAGDARRFADMVLADVVLADVVPPKVEPEAAAGSEEAAAELEAAAEPEAADDDAAGEPGVEVRPERVFVPGVKEAIRLRPGSSERYLMERIRDEAHRFAITHHRKRRAKRSLRSALDEIPGVGPALKKALVVYFGSVAAIRAASVEQLGEVKGIGPALAQRIRETLGGS